MPDPTPSSATGAQPNELLAEVRKYLQDLRGAGQLSDREERLMSDNAKLRAKLRDARTQAETVTSKLPKDGSRVLTADEAKTYDAFVALNLKPAEIGAKLTESAALSAKLAERESAELHAKVAVLLGVANPRALEKLLAREQLVIELRDVRTKQDDGTFKVEQVPYARAKADEKGTPKPLADYIEEELPEFIPSLQAEPEDDETKDAARGAAGTMTQRAASPSGTGAAGTPFPRRQTTSTPTGASKAEKAREERINSKRSSGTYNL